jgi:probable rRNA maturation factor
MSIEIKRTIRDRIPDLPFGKIAVEILGSKYELSLVICGDKLARRMNTQYRKKTYFPNVLSFPYSKADGEIFLNIRKTEREAREFDVSVKNRAALLFVHGCFHLAGYDHGGTMERLERNVLRKFGLL